MIHYNRRFNLDASIVASVIYGEQKHRFTNLGVSISADVRKELETLLCQYGAAIGAPKPVFYRLDCYFDGYRLWILEINTAFVDGWGTALNLSRAAKIPVKTEPLLAFPRQIATTDPVYLPEMKLFADELHEHMRQKLEISDDWGGLHHRPMREYPAPDVYVYGRVKETFNHIFPQHGYELDNKMNLARFEQDMWRGEKVRIPKHYVHGSTLWSDVPENSVLKFCEKGGVESERARVSVIMGKPQGKARFLRCCYETGKLLGQARIEPMLIDEHFSQAIILAINNTVVCGYVQYGSALIINDNSIHGPLMIE